MTPSRYSATTDTPYEPETPPDTRTYWRLVQGLGRLKGRSVGMYEGGNNDR